MFERIKNLASKVKTVAFTVGIGVFFYAQKGLRAMKNLVSNAGAEVVKRRNSTNSNTTFEGNANFGEKKNDVDSIEGGRDPQAPDSEDDISVASNLNEFGGFDEGPDDGYLDVVGADASLGNKIDITATTLQEFGDKLQRYGYRLTENHSVILREWNVDKFNSKLDRYTQQQVMEIILKDLNQYELSPTQDSEIIKYDNITLTDFLDNIDYCEWPTDVPDTDLETDVDSPKIEDAEFAGFNDPTAQEDEDPNLSQASLLPNLNKSAASIANDGLKATAASQKKEGTDGPRQEHNTGPTLGG